MRGCRTTSGALSAGDRSRPRRASLEITFAACPAAMRIPEVDWKCLRHCSRKFGIATWSPATDEATLLYIDRHLVHEVTSPQAFDGLRLAGRRVRRPDLTFATVDHNVPTENQLDIRDPLSRRQVETLRANCREFGVTLYDIQSGHQGIVHVIGPGAGPDAPRPDDRLRRQPHEHPRRLRGPGLRDRHQRGRARPGHADALAGRPAPLARGRGDRPARPGPGAQGHHPGHHPQDRHRRGDRPRHRVLRPGDRGPLDGRADDDLQHVDRGRSPGRD